MQDKRLEKIKNLQEPNKPSMMEPSRREPTPRETPVSLDVPLVSSPHHWVEISKSALQHNIRNYKKAIGPDTALGVVIKSNAYGHGLYEIAKICQESTLADWLFTATLSEAIYLRKNGIIMPILVMYFIDESPSKAIEYDIELMVSDRETISILHEIGKPIGKPCKIHLKIDSGMSRFGFLPEEALDAVTFALSKSGVMITGIYSHLAQAANADQTFNLEQQAQFFSVLDRLEEAGIHIPYKHLSNSAGTTSLRQERTNMVRIGLGAYGWWPSQTNKELTQQAFPDFELKPVMSLKTKIYQIRQIEANKCVGYDRTYKTTAPTRVAVLPIGYYDGYDRRLSSKGILLIHDHYAPVIGIIAMTTTLVDVTHIPQANVGDEVILMGDYERITPQQVANVIGSFNAREVMTRINPLTPRVIVP